MSTDATSSSEKVRSIEKLSAGKYHDNWEPLTIAELRRLGLWRITNGDEPLATKPTPPVTANASATEVRALNHEYKDDMRAYEESLRRNDRAIGVITGLINNEYFALVKDLDTAKDVWDALKAKHADEYTGIAAYYVRVGILAKKFSEGEDMEEHLKFLTLENTKLGTKALPKTRQVTPPPW
jgi:hypothetical protein